MSAELYKFEAHESAVLDTTRISLLRRSLGDQRCREVVEEVVFHLTDRLSLLETALDTGDMVQLHTQASRLARLSEQVGLADFSRVARDLAHCVDIKHTESIWAVSARLQRLGETSLCSVMSYADHSAL